MLCHKCDSQVPESSEFCHKCGEKLSSMSVNNNSTEEISAKESTSCLGAITGGVITITGMVMLIIGFFRMLTVPRFQGTSIPSAVHAAQSSAMRNGVSFFIGGLILVIVGIVLGIVISKITSSLKAKK